MRALFATSASLVQTETRLRQSEESALAALTLIASECKDEVRRLKAKKKEKELEHATPTKEGDLFSLLNLQFCSP